MSDEMRGWLAGILEGEGCFWMWRPAKNRPNRKPAPAIRVAMVDEDVVRRVAEIFGNAVCLKRPTDPTHQMQYQTNVYGKKAAAVMREVYPLMGQRRREKIDALLGEWA